ncbi:HemK2/MTQ2 family protein methyltransferase [Methanosphaera sp. ISO3-F5]|uniref:HemK2/MTQ2 family protein methyltransferase n=1 Tax=Methanosphaera sp. ISO3-F5 TaxID=1452353 RepID=UPI002B258BD2|nr:HemK2/MTQ2 family protein methyltransferase [Methanosphaera sp. ISO3-F5]WQH64864.1 class I SAM-dependent methyltransferase [Methanosphaera sp. ISO3-F5]
MNYDGVEFNECEEVYPPAEDTFLLIDNLMVQSGYDVLEIGTGTGLVSICASLKCSSVTSTDINPYAIKCAEANIKLNNRDNITVIKSDLFDNINGKYDLILFNTPYLPVTDEEHVDDEYSKAWDGGENGREVIDKFLKQAPQYLKENGTIQLVQSSLSDNEKTIQTLKKLGLKAEITAIEHIFFEDITLITAYKA